MSRFALTLITLLNTVTSYGQSLEEAKVTIQDLCSSNFYGRGYVHDGVNKSATYLHKQLKTYQLQAFGKSYEQSYSFPVNTHQNKIHCSIDKAEKKVGIDFLVDAKSPSAKGSFRMQHYNMLDSADQLRLYNDLRRGFPKNIAIVLHHRAGRDHSFEDSCAVIHHEPALLISTVDKKLTHTISQSVSTYPSLTFIDSTIENARTISIHFKNKFIPSYTCQNLCGYLPGARNDSLIVITAHYDHLGMQGKDALFPGASDNASGVSMLLYLAHYYSLHRPEYNTVFILFSGEEAGLMGSEYFTEHPVFNLSSIKFLINIDIIGNADKGIVVVNGETYKKEFDLLKQLNDTMQAVPEVRIRGKARNSDHYYFSEQGVPAIFIYANGGPGYYHDVWDVANSLTLSHYESIAQLLIQFISKL